jgi:hypothetical protein
MADPTVHVKEFNSYNFYPNRLINLIKTAEPLVTQGLAMIDITTGKVEFADDAENLIPMGVVLGQANGLNEKLTGDGTSKVVTLSGVVLSNVTVTGVTGITDIGKYVYATDGQTMTITKPASAVPIGVITEHVTGTYCNVYLLSLVDSVLSGTGFGKSGQYRKSLGTFITNILQGANAINLHTETATEHYKIISLHAIPKGYDNAIIAGAQTMNLEIAGTNVTGGVLTLGFASFDAEGDMGTVINATAITADNEVHIGDELQLELIAGGTGFTADSHGAVEIFMIVEPVLGA